MFKAIAHRFIIWQVENELIEEKDREIYEYGYEIFICQILNILITFIIAFLFQYYYILIFLFCYIPIRIYAGGDHANSSEKCLMTSMLILLIICLFGKYILTADIKQWLFLLELPSVIVIGLLAPIEHRNKPLIGYETKKYRRNTYIVTLIEIIAAFLFYWNGNWKVSYMIIVTHIVMAIVLIVGKRKLSHLT